MKSSSNLLKTGPGMPGTATIYSALAAGAFQAIRRNPGEESPDAILAKARRLLDEARRDADHMLMEAREEADRLVQGALDEVESIRSEAFRRGYADGLDKAAEDLAVKVKGLVSALESARDAILAQKREMMKAAEQELVELACEVASKVIKRELSYDSSCVVEAVREALRHTNGEGAITIRVSGEDLDAARDALPLFQQAVDGTDDIEILPDSRVEPGGCIVETLFGTVDARPGQQFEQIRRLLDDAGAASAD